MWLLTFNGIVYLVYGLLSGHFRRAFFPVGPTAFLRDTFAALQFKLFTGQEPPLELMTQVVRRALSPVALRDEDEAGG